MIERVDADGETPQARNYQGKLAASQAGGRAMIDAAETDFISVAGGHSAIGLSGVLAGMAAGSIAAVFCHARRPGCVPVRDHHVRECPGARDPGRKWAEGNPHPNGSRHSRGAGCGNLPAFPVHQPGAVEHAGCTGCHEPVHRYRSNDFAAMRGGYDDSNRDGQAAQGIQKQRTVTPTPSFSDVPLVPANAPFCAFFSHL